MRKIADRYLRISATLTAVALTYAPAVAMAGAPTARETGKGIGKIVDNVTRNLNTLPGLLSIVSYVGGAALGIGGIMKLKQHVDSPNQVPMKDGLVRLVGGALLIALPFVLNAILETAGGSGSNSVPLVRPSFQ